MYTYSFLYLCTTLVIIRQLPYLTAISSTRVDLYPSVFIYIISMLADYYGSLSVVVLVFCVFVIVFLVLFSHFALITLFYCLASYSFRVWLTLPHSPLTKPGILFSKNEMFYTTRKNTIDWLIDF